MNPTRRTFLQTLLAMIPVAWMPWRKSVEPTCKFGKTLHAASRGERVEIAVCRIESNAQGVAFVPTEERISALNMFGSIESHKDAAVELCDGAWIVTCWGC